MIYAWGLLAFAVAWLLPGHYFPWAAYQQDVAAAIGGLLIGLAAIASTPGRYLRLPWLSVGAATLAMVPLLQWASGQVVFLEDALLSSLYLLAFAGVSLAACALAQSRAAALTGALFTTVLLAALLSMAIGLAQWLQLGWMSWVEQMHLHGRMWANFAQPNHLASLLGLGCVATWWLYEQKKVGSAGLAATWLFFGVGMVATQSRTAWAFVLMLILWWVLMRRRCGLRLGAVGVSLGALGFVALTLLWEPANAALNMQSATKLADRVQMSGARQLNWLMLWDAALSRPWVGWGWMQVSNAQAATALAHPPAHEWLTFSHNIVLDLLIWNGLILGGVVILAILYWGWARCARCTDSTQWALLAFGGVLLVHALLEYPHAYAYFLLPFAVVAGLIEQRAGTGAVAGWRLHKAGFGGFCAFMAAMLTWIAIEYIDVEATAGRARFVEAGYVTTDLPKVPDSILLDGQRDYLWLRLTTARAAMSNEELDRMSAVGQRFMPPPVLLRQALAYGLNGRQDDARKALRLICHLWNEQRCDEGRESWRLAQAKHPILLSIEYPAQRANTGVKPRSPKPAALPTPP